MDNDNFATVFESFVIIFSLQVAQVTTKKDPMLYHLHDNTKEMIQDEFNRKLKETSCHLQQTEPLTPWSNAAEKEVKELKKDLVREMIKSSVPKRLWDNYLKLESYSLMML